MAPYEQKLITDMEHVEACLRSAKSQLKAFVHVLNTLDREGVEQIELQNTLKYLHTVINTLEI